MSSDESRTSSSRLSQFGLYRTIDARTEEFLRLSRKRQIRQGCACAAVSTALTVTVVVTVLLIYEYNIYPETKSDQRHIRKPIWFGLVNDSSPFDVKYNKAKLNIDQTTFKLLPIILKALKHNRYLQKFLEDSSTSQTFKNTDSTEESYKTNVFPKANNWMRIPGPKMYAMEHKTSPIVYNKSSKKNLDFYMKNRKIRDYKRVLNYFDKMVGDKVVVLSPPTKYYGEYAQPTVNNSKDSTTNHEETTQHFETETIESQNRIPRKYIPNCRCPNNLGILINKLLSSIQELLPEITIARSLCKYNEVTISTEPPAITTKVTKAIVSHNIHNNTSKSTSETEQTSEISSSTESIRKYITNKKKYEAYKTKNYQVKNTQNMQKTKHYNSIKSYNSVLGDSDFNDTKKTINNEQTSTIKAYLEAPNINQNAIPSITEAMPKPTKIHSINQVANKGHINLKDRITLTTQKPELQINAIKGDYIDILSTTEIDTFDLEEFEKNISPVNKGKESRINEEISDVTDTPYSVNIKELNLFTLRKMGDLIIPPKKGNVNIETTIKDEKTTIEPKIMHFSKIHKEVKENMTKNGKETPKTEYTTTEKGIEIRSEYINKTSISDISVDGNIPRNSSKLEHRRKALEDDDSMFINEDDIQDQEILNQVENIIKTPIRYNKFDPHRTNTDFKIQNHVEQESKPFSKSMLPQSRPTYLEINRSHDWKQHDNVDYDTVANQNIVFI